ncbi:GvpL/GvpF family gas vesicle protein [Amycolatopsis pigmentata]|uniref:GvpL/GvpF family gas vesicle protein n=1 Tax=Amycolatopsis pigmentata TaxID=450801 RepID=A0ABW5FJM7_9PSEU
MRLALHAVARAGHPMPPGTSFRLVVWHDLAAIVSELPRGAGVTGENALVQLGLLSGLVLDGPVVPLRFGAVAEDEDAVRAEVLAPTAGLLRAHLDRLDGMAEVHVYLKFDHDAALRAIFEEGETRPYAGLDLAARVRQGEQIGRRLVGWRRRRSDALLEPVSALAHAQAELDQDDHLTERRAFLVPLTRLETFRATTAELGGHEAVAVEYVGPLPAYNFLDVETPAASAPASRWGW